MSQGSSRNCHQTFDCWPNRALWLVFILPASYYLGSKHLTINIGQISIHQEAPRDVPGQLASAFSPRMMDAGILIHLSTTSGIKTNKMVCPWSSCCHGGAFVPLLPGAWGPQPAELKPCWGSRCCLRLHPGALCEGFHRGNHCQGCKPWAVLRGLINKGKTDERREKQLFGNEL